MQAGKLRHLLRVEHDTGQETDALNHPVPRWTLFKKVWGAVEPLEARESLRAGQMQASSLFQIKTRWFPGLDERMRIRWGSKILYLAGPPRQADQGRSTVWEFICKELNNGHQNHDPAAGRSGRTYP